MVDINFWIGDYCYVHSSKLLKAAKIRLSPSTPRLFIKALLLAELRLCLDFNIMGTVFERCIVGTPKYLLSLRYPQFNIDCYHDFTTLSYIENIQLLLL